MGCNRTHDSLGLLFAVNEARLSMVRPSINHVTVGSRRGKDWSEFLYLAAVTIVPGESVRDLQTSPFTGTPSAPPTTLLKMRRRNGQAKRKKHAESSVAPPLAQLSPVRLPADRLLWPMERPGSVESNGFLVPAPKAAIPSTTP
jgi:hypothetical protein